MSVNNSKVYWCDLRTSFGNNLLTKLRKLCIAAGIKDIDFKDKYVAIKMHFGEPGNMSFLRPNYAKVVGDLVKELGGKPYLVDCNTLYTGGRSNALDHISSAQLNGFNELTTGMHVLIGDGLKGDDEVAVPTPCNIYCPNPLIGRGVMDADIIISLSHFKGHEGAGFGGALKNIGMGCGSRKGKEDMHSASQAKVDTSKCIGCKRCSTVCAHDAQVFESGKCTIDLNKCVGCGRCPEVCPTEAISFINEDSNVILNYKIAEYTKAVIKDKPAFHISLVIDVSPFCDCHSENDAAIVPSIGFFASFDPVALDRACADAVNKAPRNSNTYLTDRECDLKHHHNDYFHTMFPTTEWEACLRHANKLGLGQENYELIYVK